MPIPTYVGAGSPSSSTGVISPFLPVGVEVDDILLLVLETSNQAVAIATENGGTWTLIDASGQGTPGVVTASRVTVFWSRYNGTQGQPTTTDPGDHVHGFIAAFRGCKATGDPFNVTSKNTEDVSDTSLSATGATTTIDDCLVVIAAALMDDAQNFGATWTNADLANLTQRVNSATGSGDDGRVAIVTGEKATAGAYGATTNTLTADSRKAMMTIALAPFEGAPPTAPTVLEAFALKSTEIRLIWLDNSDDETGFVIERSLTGVGDWTVIDTEAPDTDFFIDSTLDPLTEYFYRVKAVNAGGDSAYTNVASATTLNTAVVTITVGPCVNLMADVTFSIVDGDGALVEIENEAQQEFSPPSVVVNLASGTYSWTIEAVTGYEIIGATSGFFVVCPINRTIQKLTATQGF